MYEALRPLRRSRSEITSFPRPWTFRRAKPPEPCSSRGLRGERATREGRRRPSASCSRLLLALTRCPPSKLRRPTGETIEGRCGRPFFSSCGPCTHDAQPQRDPRNTAHATITWIPCIDVPRITPFSLRHDVGGIRRIATGDSVHSGMLTGRVPTRSPNRVVQPTGVFDHRHNDLQKTK